MRLNYKNVSLAGKRNIIQDIYTRINLSCKRNFSN